MPFRRYLLQLGLFLFQFGQAAWEAIQRTGDSNEEALRRMCETHNFEQCSEATDDETVTAPETAPENEQAPINPDQTTEPETQS